MTEDKHDRDTKNGLGKALWGVANKLRGHMDADDFRDYMLGFVFLRYLSDRYIDAAKKELGESYLPPNKDEDVTPLQRWYDGNSVSVAEFEEMMKRNTTYTIPPKYLWDNLVSLARREHSDLLLTLDECFKHIEEESFGDNFHGLFAEIRLTSDKLGRTNEQRNKKLCEIISEIAEKLGEFTLKRDVLGDAYEHLLGEFAAGGGKKAGEFYTPQTISTVLSQIVTSDLQQTEESHPIANVLDFACGSGSLLLNVRRHVPDKNAVTLYGQESNITTYNLARMNMLLHNIPIGEFNIHHGDTLKNDWPEINPPNPADQPRFDAVVANPPFSLRWGHAAEGVDEDARFNDYGVAPHSYADFAFLLHGLHYLSNQGTMAIILPHGVLFRGGAEERIRKKLLENEYIDTIIGLPANLFYSTGIPVCILVLKKCTPADDVLFINASENYTKERRLNVLTDDHIEKIVTTYQGRREEKAYSRRVRRHEITDNDCNLNITRYVSTMQPEAEIHLADVHHRLVEADKKAKAALCKHNAFLRELGLPELP